MMWLRRSERNTVTRQKTILIIGSGSLAQNVALALSDMDTTISAVHLVARSYNKLETIAHVANCRAVLRGSITRCTPHQSGGHIEDSVAPLVERTAADVVLNCSSTHSPTEVTHRPSRWTDLVQQAGIALAFPFHAQFATRVAAAVNRAANESTLYVNAAFPDAVNPVIAALNLPIHCGVGNVATLAASLTSSIPNFTDAKRIRIVAHHYHLSTPECQDYEARAWIGDTALPDVSNRLKMLRDCDRRLLNPLTGYTAARLLRDLVFDGSTTTHVPAPLGLPGGYPVEINHGRIRLDLPTGVCESDVPAWQRHWGALDGVAVDCTGEAVFSDAVLESTNAYLCLPRRIAPTEIDSVVKELDRLRRQLRVMESASA